MAELLKQIAEIGIVPVVQIDRVSDAVPLARALIDGGLPCAEITFRTAAAKESIKAISTTFPDMLLGAGTVLTTEQADAAVRAGAKFLVSPGFNPEVVSHCIKNGYTIIPGICTPSDIEAAMALGLDTVKFFPAEASGGLAMIKALSAPYVNLSFMPTGGISLNNLRSYLDHPKVIACGGSFMVLPSMINAGDFEGIRQLTKSTVKSMLGFSLARVAISSENKSDTEAAATLFSSIFGFENKNSTIEIINSSKKDEKEYIAIQTNYLDRAVRYLKSMGVQFDMSSIKTDNKGKMSSILFEEKMGGFALQLIQKSDSFI